MKDKIYVTCTAADRLPIDSILEFQGDLKRLSNENQEKLKKSILKNGFTAPIFIWKNEGDNFILDGHQRLATLIHMRQKGYDIPLLHVAYIEADDEKQAKEKLLVITSQYGEFDLEVLNDWIDDIGKGIEDTIRLANDEICLFVPDFQPGSTDDQGQLDRLDPKWIKCPHCGEEFDSRKT